MKNLFLAAAIAAMAGAADADGVPYFSRPDVPDYRASMVIHRADAEPETIWGNVIQHGGWTRVEITGGIDYGNFFKHLVLGASRDKSGAFVSLDISQVDPARDYLGIKAVKETKDEETVYGQHCRWKELARRPRELWSNYYRPEFLSCLTDDGIEVASKIMGFRKKVRLSTQLVTLQRVPVAPSELRPPSEFFDAGFWLKPLRDYPDGGQEQGDFVATLKSDGAEVVLKRHYPWLSRDERGKDGSIRFKVWNVLEDQGLSYLSSVGEKRLHANRRPRDPKRLRTWFDTDTGKHPLDRQDSLLGESCNWFDMMPNMSDGGHLQCLTPDGIPLKDVYTAGYSHAGGFDAVSIQRRPVTMQEMLPAPAMLDAKAWGFDLRD